MSAVREDVRTAGREAEARARHAAVSDVRRLDVERDALRYALGRLASGRYLGEPDAAVDEVEADLARVERDLRRAEAAVAYLR